MYGSRVEAVCTPVEEVARAAGQAEGSVAAYLGQKGSICVANSQRGGGRLGCDRAEFVLLVARAGSVRPVAGAGSVLPLARGGFVLRLARAGSVLPWARGGFVLPLGRET